MLRLRVDEAATVLYQATEQKEAQKKRGRPKSITTPMRGEVLKLFNDGRCSLSAIERRTSVSRRSISRILSEKQKDDVRRLSFGGEDDDDGGEDNVFGEYLERERNSFPRFYFVGDEDLLEILGNSKDLMPVQKHLKKLFAGIMAVEFNEQSRTISAIISREGEAVTLKCTVDL
ncbi:hypothetical protein niasHT_027106 [Heterodera trifolii]|uniref:Dynein heavy chain linker domain-containing protein n=1 Tax=Heterodera trifolii TaxID=157864 RepID=A0ABD2JKZ1_9BILA